MNRFMQGMSYGGGIMSRHEPLTDEAIKEHVPSVFAACPHESRSDRFAYVPTSAVLTSLRNEGFQPFFAQQSRSRIAGKQGFTKHMLRLRHQSRGQEQGEAHEIILVNAHDGTAAWQMLSGIFSFVCSNGLIAGHTFDEVKIGHRGNAVDRVIEGAFTVLDDAGDLMAAVDEMKAVNLTRDEQIAFAETAAKLRFKDPDKAPIGAEQILLPKRDADRPDDCWRVFNRIQENLVRGGQQGLTRDSRGRRRRARVREIKGIDQKRDLNRALWTLGQRMAELKSSDTATPPVTTNA